MTSPRNIYTSGPMRNFDGYNFPVFFAAEAEIKAVYPDAYVENPARRDVETFHLEAFMHDDPTGLTAGKYLQDHPSLFDDAALRAAMTRDLMFISGQCDLLVTLPGWRASKGATAEVAAAEAVGVPVVEFDAEFGVLRLPATPESPAAPFADLFCLGSEADADFDAMLVAEHFGPPDKGEVRVTSATGGQKGTKLAAFDQISPEVETLVAEHFGKGARKYEAHNFRKGYPWSLSYSALRRHLAAFWAGEEYDNHLPTCPEGCTDHTESLHIVAVIWHAMVLTEFYLHRKEYDDRYAYTS